ncbi:MAG TPA: TonB family protein [Candidatus Nitrosotenuis sp.]|jgi:protein TonB|nr:TonB family protein [Candidatus Nitrosotenuis sp.]
MQDLNSSVPKLILSPYGGWGKALTISGLCHSSLALIFLNQDPLGSERQPVPLHTVELHFVTQEQSQPKSVKKNKIESEKTKIKPTSTPQISQEDLRNEHSSTKPNNQSLFSDHAHLMPSSLNHPPIYPISARKDNIEGTVHLKVVISEKGVVTHITVLPPKAAKILEQAALEAVRKWTFRPHLLGSTVEVYIPIHFKLED